MCGIVGCVGERPCEDFLVNALKNLEYRGYDSAGIAVFEGEKIKTVKAKGSIGNGLVPRLEDEGPLNAVAGIGHTRWATHGEPSDINAHPQGNARVSVVHNGIIENYRKIKKFLMGKGYSFESQTDTESVAKLLDYDYNGNPIETIATVISQLEGAYSLGIIFREHKNKVYAVRRECPLIIGIGKGEMYIASDMTAILEYTKEYYTPEAGEIAEVTKDGVTFYDIHGNVVEKKVQIAEWDVTAAQKGGYEHFMLKEIHEQPTALKNTVTPRISDGIPSFEECGLTDDMLRNYKNIYIVGCGSAMHAGMVGKYVIEDIARIPVTVDIASEFKYRKPLITKDDLLIIISQSGETADTLSVLKLGKEIGADTLAAVNVAGSSIDREAKMSVKTLAGPEISVCSTKAYMVQCAFMYMFAFRLAYARASINKEKCSEYTEKLLGIPELIEECIQRKEQYQRVASKLVNASSLLYIGRGLDYALSMEGSLKLKEISYIHSESYAGGELKHGTISLVDEEMPVIAVATQTALYPKTASNVEQVKSRGAKTVVICRDSTDVNQNIADYIIRLPETDDLLMPLVTAVPLQLLAYYTALDRQCSIDKPRNLAKSVTVE